MSDALLLDRVLSLPAADIKALQEGKTIAALPIAQVPKGWNFILYPHSESESLTDIKLETWAVCEGFKMIHEAEQLSVLSALTLWSQSELKKLFEERGHLSLTLLRVYHLPQPIAILGTATSEIKLGKFIGLFHFGEAFKESVRVTKILPILSETVFANRHRQITSFHPPEHPALEELQDAISRYAQTHPTAKALDHDLRAFLGWANPQETPKLTPEWVKEIITSGNSSDGDLFEKRVRQGFVILGFTNTLKDPKVSLDPEASGGAGGVDFYCELPYPIVGECKASKNQKVNDNKEGAPFQLIKLGQKHLQPEGFSRAIKIIMAPGELTKDTNQTAIGNQMNVMRPETLQRLVELKTAHPGAIDLFELKPCLASEPFGTDADAKVNQFIDHTWRKIKVRLDIIKAVKALKEDGDGQVTASDVRNRFNAFAEHQDKLATPEIAHDLLIELSSPLTGYLGRIKGSIWESDRFYFLRDLAIK
jgi:hypothetical protein